MTIIGKAFTAFFALSIGITRVSINGLYWCSFCFLGGQTFEEIQVTLQQYALESETSETETVFTVPDKNVLLKLFDALGRNDRIIKNMTRGKKNK